MSRTTRGPRGASAEDTWIVSDALARVRAAEALGPVLGALPGLREFVLAELDAVGLALEATRHPDRDIAAAAAGAVRAWIARDHVRVTRTGAEGALGAQRREAGGEHG